MKRLLPVALLVVLASACGNVFTPGAAVVEGKSITVAELKAQVAGRSGGNQVPPGTDPADLDRQVLTGLIQQQIVLAEADRRGFKVSEADVATTLQGLRSRFPTEKDFQAQLKQFGFTLESLKQSIRDQQKIQQLETKLAGDVSEADLLTVYNSEQSQFAQIRARHITIAATTNSPKAALAKARALVAQLKKGASFAALAKKDSADLQTASAGGTIPGWQTLSAITDPGISAAAGNAKLNEIVGPLQTNGGYEIIQVFARRVQPFTEVEAQLRQQLAQQTGQQALSDFLGKALKGARVVVNPKFGDWDARTGTVVAHNAFVPPTSDQNQVVPQVPSGGVLPLPAGS